MKSVIRLGIVALSLLPLLSAQTEPGGTSDQPQKLLKPGATQGDAGVKTPTPTPTPTPNQVPNTWFPVTDLDLGDYVGADHAVGTFKFKNPNNAQVLWRSLQGSCTCSRAVIRIGDRRYELSKGQHGSELVRVAKDATGKESREVVQQIEIGPEESGELDVHLEIPNVPGPRQAYLDVHTTDEKLPQFKLKWQATSKQLFLVSPSEVSLNKMTWNETKDFTVTVSSPMHPDFNITRMDDAGTVFDVHWEKGEAGGRKTWTIQGKYGPVGSDVAGGGVLKFYTDVQGQASFTVRVVAMVQGPMEIKPGAFMALGLIHSGQELAKEVVFEPNDGTKIEATALQFEKLTIPDKFVSVNSHNDGNKLVVEVVVSKEAPSGLLKGELVVDLNHPQVKQRRILFNGFVR